MIPHNDQSLSKENLQQRFSYACELYESKNLPEALAIYIELLDVFPKSTLLHFNCGLAYFTQDDFVKAETHYANAAKLSPDDPDIHHNRGLNFRRLQQYSDAINCFESAIKTGDCTIDTLYNMALSYQDLENFIESSRLYNIILDQSPEHQASLNNYAYLCHKNGKTDQAISLYRQLLLLNPEHNAAKHMLNALTGKTPDTAPIEYVELVFDNYADHFDESLLKKLHYNTPQALLELYTRFSESTMNINCLDLGCGTGLSGEHFSKVCRKLTGVDISQKMLAVATEKNIYDTLIKDDILHFLQHQKKSQQFDLILAADVFTYMGDLQHVFRECHTHINQSGSLLFSVEEPLHSQTSYELKPTGRFAHPETYIKGICGATGWRIISQQSTRLRRDKGKWIIGCLYLLEPT